jgi:hypothetical protein
VWLEASTAAHLSPCDLPTSGSALVASDIPNKSVAKRARSSRDSFPRFIGVGVRLLIIRLNTRVA